MIPYFEFTQFNLGPVPVQVWGLMVALGILCATWVAGRFAEHRGQDGEVMWDTVFWAILGAFIFARVFHVFFYELSFYLENPSQILAIWHGGWSSVGGFLGGAIGGLWYLKKRNVDVWAYADTAVFGLPVGLFLGRIGCFLIHDHPGTATDFILGVEYPDGIVRHDHGLYLALNGLLMSLVFAYLAKRNAKTGTYIVTFLVWYGLVRFPLDFLRADSGAIVDKRWLGLTPAQYFALLMVAVGVYLYRTRVRIKKPT